MQFTYSEESGNSILTIQDDTYKYLIKARRHKVGDKIYFRNLKDNFIHLYELISIDRRSAIFNHISSEEKVLLNNTQLHLGWCVVDPKTVEKYIASLNEMGVEKITFIYSEFSQKNFTINIEKLEKILINSSSQCGRSNIIKIELCDSIEKFLTENDNVYFLDFSHTNIENKKDNIKTLVIGCEGGFSENERKIFDKKNIVGFNSSLILRSETAIISASSKILL